METKTITITRKGAYFLIAAPGTDEEAIAKHDDDAELAAAIRDIAAKAKSGGNGRARVVQEAQVVEDAAPPSGSNGHAQEDEGPGLFTTLWNLANSPEGKEALGKLKTAAESASVSREFRESRQPKGDSGGG